VCAGKGTKHLPAYHAITPDTVWDHYGFTRDQVAEGGFNARRFTSFIDGTKSAIEMAAVCNATGLEPQDEGLRFPPAGTGDLATVCVPRSAGGALSRSGTVEVVSSVAQDGRPVADDLRWGVYVTFEASSPYVARCFRDYGLATDPSGQFAALYRPYHLIGLETTVSVLAAGLLGQPTGVPARFRADVVAVAKHDLQRGDLLDGEGGFAVHGALVAARRSVAEELLPIALAHGIRLAKRVRTGAPIRLSDLANPPADTAAALRAELCASASLLA
jgi:predicted homoserine dehydrogenase-like protein